jgi:hypothetical protein
MCQLEMYVYSRDADSEPLGCVSGPTTLDVLRAVLLRGVAAAPGVAAARACAARRDLRRQRFWLVREPARTGLSPDAESRQWSVCRVGVLRGSRAANPAGGVLGGRGVLREAAKPGGAIVEGRCVGERVRVFLNWN